METQEQKQKQFVIVLNFIYVMMKVKYTILFNYLYVMVMDLMVVLRGIVSMMLPLSSFISLGMRDRGVELVGCVGGYDLVGICGFCGFWGFIGVLFVILVNILCLILLCIRLGFHISQPC